MIARTIYTGTQSSLTFDSKILVFNGSILTFYYYGLDFFNIEGFTFDEIDMGDAQITADLYLPADFVPNFSRDWYMEFRGEKFYNKTLQPPVLKDTSSLFTMPKRVPPVNTTDVLPLYSLFSALTPVIVTGLASTVNIPPSAVKL